MVKNTGTVCLLCQSGRCCLTLWHPTQDWNPGMLVLPGREAESVTSVKQSLNVWHFPKEGYMIWNWCILFCCIIELINPNNWGFIPNWRWIWILTVPATHGLLLYFQPFLQPLLLSQVEDFSVSTADLHCCLVVSQSSIAPIFLHLVHTQYFVWINH